MTDERREGAAQGAREERTHVFEAINETLKEFYVGLSPVEVTLEELQRRHRDEVPAPIAHWQPDHRISYRCVESGIPRNDGLAFVGSYAMTVSQIGWTVITD